MIRSFLRKCWIIVGFICASPLFAADCNPTTQAGCATDPPTTNAGTFTPIALPNTGWTQGATTISGIDAIAFMQYGSNACSTTFNTSQGCLDAFFIHGIDFASAEQIWCWHGGGFVGGNREGCYGQSNNYKSPVMQLQALADTPNSSGVKGGFVIIEADYPWATPLGTNPFPANWQQMKCAEAYYQANTGALNSGFPGAAANKRMTYGPSAGGPLAWWQANSSDTAYAWSCPTAAQAKPSVYYDVAAWTPMSMALPSGNATIDNCTGCTTNALYNLLSNPSNVSTLALARTQDTNLQASPYLLIADSNAANLSKHTMFQWGSADTLIPGTWAGGGNKPLTIAAYAALASPISIVVETITGGHEADLGTLPYAPSVTDARNFLTGTPLSAVQGVAGISGAAGIQ